MMLHCTVTDSEVLLQFELNWLRRDLSYPQVAKSIQTDNRILPRQELSSWDATRASSWWWPFGTGCCIWQTSGYCVSQQTSGYCVWQTSCCCVWIRVIVCRCAWRRCTWHRCLSPAVFSVCQSQGSIRIMPNMFLYISNIWLCPTGFNRVHRYTFGQLIIVNMIQQTSIYIFHIPTWNPKSIWSVDSIDINISNMWYIQIQLISKYNVYPNRFQPTI